MKVWLIERTKKKVMRRRKRTGSSSRHIHAHIRGKRRRRKLIRRLVQISICWSVFTFVWLHAWLHKLDKAATTSLSFILHTSISSSSSSNPLTSRDQPTTTTTTTTKKKAQSNTLVIYAGPRSVVDVEDDKSVLRWKNFHYFLKHGITCHEDVIMVVGYNVLPFVETRVRRLVQECQSKATVSILPRQDECHDMEAVRVGLNAVHQKDYPYVVVMTDSVTGPHIPPALRVRESWTTLLTNVFAQNARIRMVGLTLYCRGDAVLLGPHVGQSLYALDRRGLELVRRAGCIYNCRTDPEGGNQEWSVTHRYEMGMGRAILQAGYGLADLLQNKILVAPHNQDQDHFVDHVLPEQCTDNDIWYRHELYRRLHKLPTLQETHFFQSSRFVTEEVAYAIGYDNNQDLDQVLMQRSNATATTTKTTKRKRQRIFSKEQRAWDAEVTQIGLGGRSMMHHLSDRLLHPTDVYLIQHRCTSLHWVGPYFQGIRVRNYTVFGNCATETLLRQFYEADQSKVQTRQIDTSVAPPPLLVATIMLELAQEYYERKKTNTTANNNNNDDEYDKEIIVLWDGDAHSHMVWNAREMINGAEMRGFACRNKPQCSSARCEARYQPTVLHLPQIWNDWVWDPSNTTATWGPLRPWATKHLGATLPHHFIPVCHDNSFAFRRSQLGRQPLSTWQALHDSLWSSLIDGDETLARYAERTWVALLTNPLHKDEVESLSKRAANALAVPDFGDLIPIHDHQREMRGMILWEKTS